MIINGYYYKQVALLFQKPCKPANRAQIFCLIPINQFFLVKRKAKIINMSSGKA